MVASTALYTDRSVLAGRRWLCAPVFWAAFGAATIVFQAWVFIRWAIDGNARLNPVPFDSGTMPTWLRISTEVEDVALSVGCVLLLAVAWRQSRTAGRITLNAALTVGYFLSFWSNPYSGTFHHAVGENRHGLHVMSWGPYLPGWQGPEPQIETLAVSAAYPWVVFWVWMGLGWAWLFRRWRPGWSRARVTLATIVASVISDIPMEHAVMRFGAYNYPRELPGLTLFPGEWYQIPITSPLCLVFLAATPIVLMKLYKKPDREVWLLEGSLSLPRPAQPWVRLLAGVGIVNAAMLGLQLVMMLASLVSHPIDIPSWYQLPQP